MKTMSIFQVEEFDLFGSGDDKEIHVYQSDITDEPEFKVSTEPITKLKLITEQFHKNFSYIEIEHESKKSKNIRVKDDFYDFFFLRQNTIALYNADEKILLILANKYLAKEIAEVLSTKYRNKFKLVPEDKRQKFDFNKLTNEANLINTWGAWFKDIGYSNVKSMALFGDHVQLDQKYEENIKKISSINIDFSLNDEPTSLIISKDLRVTVLTNTTESQMIDYYYIVKNLFD